jgi:EAL domain-containing protein (putative c-di-GMP-specific phosphodiesterase class I)
VMDAAAEARRNLEIDLRGALSRGEFEIYYQPLVEAQTGRPTGAEALVRWRHPRNGLVSPADFIALAEETGFIVQLGEWVLRQACRDAAEWPADLRIAVNISAVQFRQARFVEVVMHVLAETGLPPERLELEITETVLMKSLPPVVEALHLLRRLGVRISLDDFGTGYSSLSYLRTFPFDKLKIDQSFVQDLGDPATVSILQAMIALGHGLGMSVTAEGVETEAQRTAVLGFGCTHLQGYLFGRPRSKDDFVREHLSGRNQRAD